MNSRNRPCSASTSMSAPSSASSASDDGTGRLARSWSKCDVVRPNAPSRRHSASSAAIATRSALGRGALPRVVAHHEHAQRGVPDHARRVHREVARLHRVAVPGPALPRPRDADVERLDRHVFDVAEDVDEQLALVGAHGREGERAVPEQHGGHTVLRHGIGAGIPEQRRVEMRVGVDEPGRHERARRVDLRFAVGP